MRIFYQRNVFPSRFVFEDDGSAFNFENETNSAIELIKNKVGGSTDDETAKSTSFEAIRSAFDKIPAPYFKDQSNQKIVELYKTFSDLGRAKMLKEFSEFEKNRLNSYLKRIEALTGMEDSSKRLGVITEAVPTADRLFKIANLILSQTGEVNEDDGSSQVDEPERILKTSGNIAKTAAVNFYNSVFSSQRKMIEGVPLTLEGNAVLEIIKKLIDHIGLDDLRSSVKQKQEKIDQESARSGRRDSATVKNKHRIVRRLIDAISMAKLPAISEGKVTADGDYYKLFTRLSGENQTTMDDSISRAFKNNLAAASDFKNRAVKGESALEEDQLSYLTACRSWIHSYIVNAKNGEFNQKETDGAISRLDAAYSEKTKEIKNYYLAKEFNLGNFGGLQIKPEIRLPLYTKVKLAVSEADRIKESPLRNFSLGLGKIASAIFGAIPDRVDQAALSAAVARNKALFGGISSMIKAATSAIGGKQAGRDYEEKIEKPASGFLFGKEGSGVKEDMLNLSDATGAVPVNPESPGQTMQVPAVMVPNNMDKMALAGPGKKKKKKEEKPVVAGSKVMNFSEFLSRKE